MLDLEITKTQIDYAILFRIFLKALDFSHIIR